MGDEDSMKLPVAVVLGVLAAGAWLQKAPASSLMNELAERYVKVVLALGQHDADYVDAFYGPPEWKKEAEAAKIDLDTIAQRASTIRDELKQALPPDSAEELVWLRWRYLDRQLMALQARVRMLKGERLSFDDESKALYDAVAPTNPDSHFEKIVNTLDTRFPGQGSLAVRYDAWRKPFTIAKDKLDAVFKTAIAAGRERTRAHFALPDDESFTLEYVTNKPWSGYNWYQGNNRSVIQINTDLPIYIDRAIDLACHEGYPGHHVYNALLEKHLARDRGWVEYSVYPLYSPQSLIAEGTANFGIEVAFPGHERVEYEKKVLFPLADIDPARADEYYEVQALVDQLSYAGNEAARRYLNGQFTAGEAAAYLEQYALYAPDRAKQRVTFIEKYRSYVINYNYGKDLVRRYIESRGGTASNPAKRWAEFEQLLSSPRLPSSLQ
jgi:hypothetical protein